MQSACVTPQPAWNESLLRISVLLQAVHALLTWSLFDCQVRVTKDAKLVSTADAERGLRAVLNEMGTLKEDLPELPRHVRRCRV